MRRANIDFIRSIFLCWLDMMSPQSFLISGSWMDALSHMRIAPAWCGIIAVKKFLSPTAACCRTEEKGTESDKR
jgi:hypothetical protein